MSMLKPLMRLAGVSALVGAAALVFTVSASAAPAHLTIAHARGGVVNAPAASTLPIAKITENTKGKTAFKPTTLSVVTKWNGKQACTRLHQSFAFANKTSAAQAIDASGSFGTVTDFVTIQAGNKAGVCFHGTGTETFTIEGNTGTLTVTVS